MSGYMETVEVPTKNGGHTYLYIAVSPPNSKKPWWDKVAWWRKKKPLLELLKMNTELVDEEIIQVIKLRYDLK